MKILSTLLVAGVLSGLIVAQTAPARLEFEVVSLKPAEGLIAGKPAAGGTRVDGAQVHIANAPLRGLITLAYKLKNYQVIGPEWLASPHFDIDAKLPAGATRTQVPDMVRSMLEDRFQLKAHNEDRELAVYGLVVIPGGRGLRDLSDSDDKPDVNGATQSAGYGSPKGMGTNYGDGSSYDLQDGKFDAKKLSMTRLASLLTNWVDRPVIDMTRLTGKYDISFPMPDDELHALIGRAFLFNGGTASPEYAHQLEAIGNDSLYAGLRAAGLKLEPRKAPVQVLVIDSILKSPTVN
jgi:uncharacterized protein (TIGR03435 family)